MSSDGSAPAARRSRPPARPANGAASDTADDLIARVSADDRVALLALYDAVGSRLMAVALRVTGTRGDAEEVVQDALLRAWREAASFDRSRGTALAWLVTLARNRAVDVVRMRGRRSRHEAEAADAAPGESTPDPERATLDVQRAHALRDALASLSSDQQAALDLAYFGGLSHVAVAARLGLPLGTVKTRIFLAVRHLRARLVDASPSDEEP